MQIKYNNMKLIETKFEYNKALKRMEEIFDAEPNTKEGQEADVLALLIEEYEEENYKIDSPDPIVAIKIRMEELKLKQKDLVGVVGSKGIVSEVLNKKRRLTINMIRNLSDKLKIAVNVLIQEYQLNS
jgi:HTH-type transcriptional regulator/antitoxin HigA